MMTIAVIQNYLHPYVIGGAEINVENYIQSLSKRGVRTVVITSGKKRRCEVSSSSHLKIYRIFPFNVYFNYPPSTKRSKILKFLWWAINLWNPFVFLKVRSILKKENPQVVNIRNFYGLSPSVFTAAKSLGLPVIFTAHDFFALCKNASFLRKEKICHERCWLCSIWGNWNKIFMRRIHFHFLSSFSADIFKTYLAVKSSIMIHNPVYLSEEEIQKNILAKKKRQQGFPSLRFIMLGRLSPYKGVSTAVEAFRKLKSTHVEFLIGGEGELRKRVEAWAQEDPRIKYLGFVTGESKRQALLNSDVLLLPSQWYEVSPLTLQEAYGFGLPVIGANLGSIPEHIDIDETGWLFSYKDVPSLLRIIEDLSQNRELVREGSEKSFAKALENTRDKNIERIIEYYGKLLDQEP